MAEDRGLERAHQRDRILRPVQRLQAVEEAGDLVRSAVDLICRFDLPEAEVVAHLRGVERRLAETFPETLDEARGIADGAGVGADEALALSVCSDLSGKLPAWCSLVAVPGGI